MTPNPGDVTRLDWSEEQTYGPPLGRGIAPSPTAAFATFTAPTAPAGVTAEQQVRALLAWAERQPGRLTETRRATAVDAFLDAWLCG